MIPRIHSRSIVLAAVAGFLTIASTAAAQAVIQGQVTNTDGVALAGVHVSAESDEDPTPRTTTTNDAGEYTIVGVRTGAWYLTFTADGYLPVRAGQRISSLEKPDPIDVQMEPGVTLADGAAVDTSEVQAALEEAGALSNMGDYAGALAAYEALSEKLPDVMAVRIQIAALYVEMKQYDKAIAEYDAVLAKEPGNQRAKTARATTILLTGDTAAAEAALTEAAGGEDASADTYYNLAEVMFADGNTDGAAEYYQKASAANPAWGKPLFKLALVALNKGDMDVAASFLEKVIEADPTSEDAGSARLMLQQLRPQ